MGELKSGAYLQASANGGLVEITKDNGMHYAKLGAAVSLDAKGEGEFQLCGFGVKGSASVNAGLGANLAGGAAFGGSGTYGLGFEAEAELGPGGSLGGEITFTPSELEKCF